MKKEKIWIDCDPGLDDAVALAMIAASRDVLEICGISTVSGNQTIERVTENALRLSALLGMKDVPVAAGAKTPLVRIPEVAGDIHGESGLGNYEPPKTDKQPNSMEGVRFLHDFLMSLPEGEQLTLVPTGPLTNVALLFLLYPEVKKKIRRIVLMGGSSGGGNVTPSAEFNIWVDPEAAKVVFNDEIPIVMCGLDVTMKCGLTLTQIDTLKKSSDPLLQAYGEMLGFYGGTTEGEREAETEELVFIHDAVTILYITNPELFAGIPVNVSVDCSEEKRGKTTCTACAPSSRQPAGVLMLNQVNLPEFQKTLLQKLYSLKA